MKRHAVLLFTLICLIASSCSSKEGADSAEAGTDDARRKNAEMQAPPPNPAQTSVILQGLMAFVPGADVASNPTLEALLPDTSQPPSILHQDVVSVLHLPQHQPYVAIERGELQDGASACFLDTTNPTELYLHWENGGGGLTLQAHSLCGSSNCPDLRLEVGSNPFGNPFTLDRLVDANDFPTPQQHGFFQVDSDLSGDLAARIRISKGSEIEANVVEPTADFSFRNYERNATYEEACPTEGTTKKFAEQVTVTGSGVVRLTSTNGECVVHPTQAGEAPKVWIFHVAASGYVKPGPRIPVPRPHHEAFYWFYEISSTPRLGQPETFSRPCPYSGGLGDPKCPQSLMTAAP